MDDWRLLWTIVPLLMAGLPLLGLVRTRRIQTSPPDPRIRAFQWFFGLYATGVILRFGSMLFLMAQAPRPPVGPPSDDARILIEAAGIGSTAFTVVALAVVAFAYIRRSNPAVVMALAPLMVWRAGTDVLAAALALVPAWFALQNYRANANPRTLRISIGFGLLALGQLGFIGFLVRDAFVLGPFSQAVSLIGIATLVAAFPQTPKQRAA